MRFREVEKKFYVRGMLSRDEIDLILKDYLKPAHQEYGASTDLYFKPGNGTADFIRLRNFGALKSEITTKRKDQSTNLNRREVNVDCSTGPARAFCEDAFGEPFAELHKTYSVYYPWFDSKIAVSTYCITSVPNKVFLEVEAPRESQVLGMAVALRTLFELMEEPRSLFELIQDGEIPSNVSKEVA